MFTLGEIEQSEHNLLGAITEEDFLEALDTAPAQTKKKFFKKMQMQSTQNCLAPIIWSLAIRICGRIEFKRVPTGMWSQKQRSKICS